MSTLLSDLDSSPAASKDGDLVDQILKEMNGPPLPPSPAMIPAQMPNTAVNSYSMNTNPATAHVIGGAHPTPADFAAAMHSAPTNFASGAPYQEPQPPAIQQYRPPKKSYTQRFGEEFKIPILVSMIVFIFSLPVINILFAHYLPSMMLSTGQLTTIGLLIKSLGAGVVFWILQRVIVPLFAL